MDEIHALNVFRCTLSEVQVCKDSVMRIVLCV